MRKKITEGIRLTKKSYQVLKVGGMPVLKHKIALYMYKKYGRLVENTPSITSDNNNHSIVNTSQARTLKLYLDQQNEINRLEANKIINSFTEKVLVSIIMPVYNTPVKFLEMAIKSLQAQFYDHWELCAVDDCSPDLRPQNCLLQYAKQDSRIRYFRAEKNGGISKASNIALDMATGKYIALLDHDDELTPDALFWMVYEINKNNNLEMLYSDEMTIHEDFNVNKTINSAFIKPDWSPELLDCCMYTGHLTVYSKQIVKELGGFRTKFDFSQDYDLALRVSEKAKDIKHIERILYLWRAIEGSAAKGGKDFARITNLSAIADAWKRRGKNAYVVNKPYMNKVRFQIKENPLVSIIIPTDSRENLSRSIDAILNCTTYSNYEIVPVCNSKLAKEIQEDYAFFPLNVVRYDKKYNFSDKCNEGAKNANGEYLVFYNDDIIPLNSDWLSLMYEQFQKDGVGAVSPKMIYENNTIQYAGIYTGSLGLMATYYHSKPHNFIDMFNSMHRWNYNVSVISGACFIIPKNLFNQIDGFDSINTPNGHSDGDISFRIREKGFRCVYIGDTLLRHIGNHSWATGDGKDKSDIYLLKKWGKYLNHDPYYTHAMRTFLDTADEFPFKFKCYIPEYQQNMLRKSPNVLLISHEMRLSGAPRALLYAAQAIQKMGGFPVVMSAKDGNMCKEFYQKGISVIVNEGLYSKNCVYDSLFRNFANNFDAVIMNTVENYRIVELFQGLNVKFLLWLHEGMGVIESYKKAGINIIEKIEKSSKICIGSPLYVEDYSKKTNRKDIEMLLYAFPDFAPKNKIIKDKTKSEKIVFLQAGTLEPRKGIDIFIGAVRFMKEELRKKAIFQIIGSPHNSPPYLAFAQEMTKQASEFPEIEILPQMPFDTLTKYYENADVIVCASLEDPMPLTVTEGMMFAKPCILSSACGTSKLFIPDEEVFVFENRHCDVLARKMEKLIESKETRQKFGKASRKRYEEYFIEEKFDEHFQKIVHGLCEGKK